MLDVRPVFYVIGLMIAALGGFMLAPALADFLLDDPHWRTCLLYTSPSPRDA